MPYCHQERCYTCYINARPRRHEAIHRDSSRHQCNTGASYRWCTTRCINRRIHPSRILGRVGKKNNFRMSFRVTSDIRQKKTSHGNDLRMKIRRRFIAARTATLEEWGKQGTITVHVYTSTAATRSATNYCAPGKPSGRTSRKRFNMKGTLYICSFTIMRTFVKSWMLHWRILGASRRNYWTYVAIQEMLTTSTAYIRHHLTLLGPQSRFGHNLLEIWLVCPQNGAAVLKGLKASSASASSASSSASAPASVPPSSLRALRRLLIIGDLFCMSLRYIWTVIHCCWTLKATLAPKSVSWSPGFRSLYVISRCFRGTEKKKHRYI